MPKVPKITSLQYLKENVKNEVDFLPADKRQRFVQIDIIIFVSRHAQSTQNKKFAYHCIISRKVWGKNEVDFLPADKLENFLQVDSFTLGMCS